MMSALGGGSPKKQTTYSTDKLRECDSDKGEGVKKSENFADVLCTCPLALLFFKKTSGFLVRLYNIFSLRHRPSYTHALSISVGDHGEEADRTGN